jgi:hypothetical protein
MDSWTLNYWSSSSIPTTAKSDLCCLILSPWHLAFTTTRIDQPLCMHKSGHRRETLNFCSLKLWPRTPSFAHVLICVRVVAMMCALPLHSGKNTMGTYSSIEHWNL